MLFEFHCIIENCDQTVLKNDKCSQQMLYNKSDTYRLMVDLKLMLICPNLNAFIQTIFEIIFILKCIL